MAETSYPLDGLRVALEMERRGAALYARARMITEDPKLVELLTELEKDEKRHYAQFQAMMEVFGLPEMTPEENELAASKAADFFFPGGLMKMAMDGKLESSATLLKEAMQAERDSISFYGRLLSHVNDLEQQEIIMRIIREEMRHLHVLTDRQNEFQSEGCEE